MFLKILQNLQESTCARGVRREVAGVRPFWQTASGWLFLLQIFPKLSILILDQICFFDHDIYDKFFIIWDVISSSLTVILIVLSKFDELALMFLLLLYYIR